MALAQAYKPAPMELTIIAAAGERWKVDSGLVRAAAPVAKVPKIAIRKVSVRVDMVASTYDLTTLAL
jgi:hypothetical protein